MFPIHLFNYNYSNNGINSSMVVPSDWRSKSVQSITVIKVNDRIVITNANCSVWAVVPVYTFQLLTGAYFKQMTPSLETSKGHDGIIQQVLTWNSSLSWDELLWESTRSNSLYATSNSLMGMAVSPHRQASRMASWMKIYCSWKDTRYRLRACWYGCKRLHRLDKSMQALIGNG